MDEMAAASADTFIGGNDSLLIIEYGIEMLLSF
jgi:hypothetical protein